MAVDKGHHVAQLNWVRPMHETRGAFMRICRARRSKFVDWEKYRLGRLQSEMRTEFKKSAMKNKE
jgi:hypothetical protein